MKIIIETSGASQLSHHRPPSDLSRQKTPRRKTKSFGGGERSERGSSKRSVHHDTPLVKWMLSEFIHQSNSVEKTTGEVGSKGSGTIRPAVSARKLGAVIWRLKLPDSGINGRQWLGFQFVPSLEVSHSSMEGSTNFFKPTLRSPLIPALEKQLKQARARINELETEASSSKDKIEQFLQKFNEERAAWKSREHEKVHAIVDDMKAELSREKKNRQRLEVVHSKLVNELADAKLSFKRCVQQYGKERKARELAQEVCDELARETGEDKAEFETLKIESKKLWEEMEDERKMLQMAEVWREERVQMKLVDAKIMLEEKYSQMNKIIADVEAFQKSRSTNADLKDRNLDMCFLFQGIDFSESKKREDSPCTTGYSPPRTHMATPLLNKDSAYRRDVYMDGSGELIEDALSQSDDHGSSCSTNGSDPCVNSKRPLHLRKASRLRRSFPSHGAKSVEGVNQKLSNERLSSTETMVFPNCGSMNQHRSRGTQKNGLKSQYSEARRGSQKNPALKQKI